MRLTIVCCVKKCGAARCSFARFPPRPAFGYVVLNFDDRNVRRFEFFNLFVQQSVAFRDKQIGNVDRIPPLRVCFYVIRSENG